MLAIESAFDLFLMAFQAIAFVERGACRTVVGQDRPYNPIRQMSRLCYLRDARGAVGRAQVVTRAMETQRDPQPVAETAEREFDVRVSQNLDKMA